MSTLAHPRHAAVSETARHAAWFAGGTALAFAVPYVGVSLLDLSADVYYLLYFAVALGLIAAYVRAEQVDVASFLRRQWRLSLALGVLCAAFVVGNVLSADATPRPHGAYFAFELLWRGAGYGAIDALLLTAFPGMVAYALLHGRIDGLRRRSAYAALALALIMIITGVYHAGYPQYRQDGVAKPETGNTIISIPMLATANPAGSVVAHVSMHVAAVTHSYETHVFLPPATKA